MRQAALPSVAIGLTFVSMACGGGGSGGDEVCESPASYAIPFDYSLESDHIAIHTDGGDLYTMIGPWGAHTGPHTGHPEGNSKSDWAGAYASSLTDDHLVRLEGAPTPGACNPGEACGVHIDDIADRIPVYLAPADGFLVREVRLETRDSGTSEYDRQKWIVDGGACPYTYHFDHLGSIGRDLRQAMLDAGYQDPDSAGAPVGQNLISGSPVTLSKGQAIAIPQIRMQPVAGFPDYFQGWGGVTATPWAQLEFTARLTDDTRIQSELNFVDQDTRAALEAILYAEAGKGYSMRYDQFFVEPWLAYSELVLEATAMFDSTAAVDSIYARFGGWWERAEVPCVAWQDPACNDQLSIFDVHKESPFYDAGLYYGGADTSYLVYRRTGQEDGAYGEVIGALPNPTSGAIVIRWRPSFGQAAWNQALSYRLFPDQERLVVHFGDASGESDDPRELPLPAPPSSTADCDTIDTVCYGIDGYWNDKGGT